MNKSVLFAVLGSAIASKNKEKQAAKDEEKARAIKGKKKRVEELPSRTAQPLGTPLSADPVAPATPIEPLTAAPDLDPVAPPVNEAFSVIEISKCRFLIINPPSLTFRCYFF